MATIEKPKPMSHKPGISKGKPYDNGGKLKKKHIKIFNQIILNKILNNLQNDIRRIRIIRIN